MDPDCRRIGAHPRASTSHYLKMSLEYTLYADESTSRGKHFSDFYGGCLVSSADLEIVVADLLAKKHQLGFHNEVKWQRVTEQYLDRYVELVRHFFVHVASRRVRIRIMFTQNRNIPTQLTARHRDESYFILYYQFIKHAFGFQHAPHGDRNASLRVYVDTLPDIGEKIAKFRGYILGLNASSAFRDGRIQIAGENITQVDSRSHVLLQCVDLVLGAMQFRLNDLHRVKPAGAKRRGKRTRAKEQVYKAILAEVQKLYPRFNIGMSTGRNNDPTRVWSDPYRHWLFVPKSRDVDKSATKQHLRRKE